MSENYFYTKTIFQSPSFIKNEDQKLPVNENIFFTPGNSLQLEYVNAANGKWDALIYRPEIRAQDHFKIAKYLSFHLYSTQGTTSESLPEIQLMSVDSVLSKKCFFQITKTNSWEQVIIPIDSFGIKINNAPDITTVVFSQHNNDGKKKTIYIDDIDFLSSTSAANIIAQSVLTGAKGYAKHIDIQWQSFSDNAVKYVKIYRSVDEKNYQ